MFSTDGLHAIKLVAIDVPLAGPFTVSLSLE